MTAFFQINYNLFLIKRTAAVRSCASHKAINLNIDCVLFFQILNTACFGKMISFIMICIKIQNINAKATQIFFWGGLTIVTFLRNYCLASSTL